VPEAGIEPSALARFVNTASWRAGCGFRPQGATHKKSPPLVGFLRVVPEAGIEPARLAAGDFESPASTNFTTPAALRAKLEIMAQ
jgi:hypothetical protein